MAKTIRNLRGYVKRFDEKLESPPTKARAKIRSVEAKRINLVSICRAILDRSELPLAAKQEAWIKTKAEYTSTVKSIRTDALDELKENYDEAETLLLQLSKFSAYRPESDKWSEYQALSPDVRKKVEETAKGSPSKIVAMYVEAQRLDDSMACFAIEQFGLEAIQAAQSELGATGSDHVQYSRALGELNDLISESSPERQALELKVKSIQKDITAAEGILKGLTRVKMSKPKGSADPDKFVVGMTVSSDEIDIRKRFRLDVHDGLSALDLECGIGYISGGDGHLARQLRDDDLHNRPHLRVVTQDVLPPGSITDKVEGRVRKLEAEDKDE